MSKAEERALDAYPIVMSQYSDNCKEYDSNESDRLTFIEGYHQAEKDLLENKHEKSWRLDEKLWKGIKDIKEASYQYMYDASNDWAYDIPTWEDVQDAFKAGSEWKEDLELTWEDMRELHIIFAKIDVDIELCKTDIKSETIGYYEEVLKRFKSYGKKKI